VQLALIKTGYKSIEDAVDYIYGYDLGGMHKHPFVGEHHENRDSFFDDSDEIDPDRNIALTRPIYSKCFICDGRKTSHVMED
jgi:hypothetical protein